MARKPSFSRIIRDTQKNVACQSLKSQSVLASVHRVYICGRLIGDGHSREFN